jgi:diphthamide biosynthesis protein 7
MIRIGQTPTQDCICLAVAWNHSSSSSSRKKLVSSYSNGQVAIHNVHCVPSESSNSNSTIGTTTLASLELVESWSAHQMFHNPAEVWAACFQTHHDDIVLTGGDEGQLKIWDIRTGTSRPIQTLSKTFEAGVTVLSPHSRKEHWVAAGSYDETMALLDLRMVSTSQPPRVLHHSDPLGGGLWRIKWHPHNDTRLLIAAMHGGCRVVDLDLLDEEKEEGSMNLYVRQQFTNHQSMAYGADWLVHSTPNRTIQAAVSCSFYDQAMYLWNVQ